MPLPETPGRQVRDYHKRTKHHVHRFARSAGYMDWDNQPDPFRTYAGTHSIPLPLVGTDPPVDYASLFHPAEGPPAPWELAAIGLLFELSMGLSAWKAVAGQRWALRMNPSSGNLHPTEAHLIALGFRDLPDGLYHYHPLEHTLEERARISSTQVSALAPHLGTPCGLVALTSIFWREAWKYGERAFRYCQHDVGHALAALRLSARLLNWRLVCLEAADEDIAIALGFDRTSWPPQEAEAPALIAALLPAGDARLSRVFPAEAARILGTVEIIGRPNRLSPEHRDWDIIPQTAAACCRPRETLGTPLPETGPDTAIADPAPAGIQAAAVIRQRRSAQAFDPRRPLDREAFLNLLDRTRPRPECPPFDALNGPARISLVLFVHRVQDVAPGLYAFIRHPDHLADLRQAASAAFAWEPQDADRPFFLLEPGDVRAEAIDLSCRQEIGGFGTFSLGMLARFESEVRDTPWVYRELFWEAGLIGQVLYLGAEACGMRGTGIGCYFDDAVHQRLGLQDRAWQSLYHFTVGVPIEDSRLQTLPPYFHLDPGRRPSPDAHFS
jgi:SagB-type dehydrogenase family enzyme